MSGQWWVLGIDVGEQVSLGHCKKTEAVLQYEVEGLGSSQCLPIVMERYVQ